MCKEHILSTDCLKMGVIREQHLFGKKYNQKTACLVQTQAENCLILTFFFFIIKQKRFCLQCFLILGKIKCKKFL